MKKINLLILIFVFITDSIDAQSIYFNKRIDVTGDYDVCRGILPFNKGYLVAGGHGPGYIVYLSYLDSVGNIKWTQHYSEISYNYFFGLSGSLFQTKDNYYAICGGRVPPGPKGYGILLKVDSLGNSKWEKEYQLLNNDNVFNSGNITRDSGYILTGDAHIGSLGYRYLLIKTDSLGNQQWYKTYTDNDPNRNYAGKCVIETPDKGYCLGGSGGYWSVPGSNYRGIAEIIKTDSLGNQQWKKTYGNPLNCNLDAKISLSKDSCIIATYSIAFSSNADDDRQIYIVKLDLNGNEKWNKKIGNIQIGNNAKWLQTLDDGSLILCGDHFVKDTVSKYIGWLFKLNGNGDSLWYREYAVIQGPQDANELELVISTPDKGFAGAGSLFPYSTGGNQDIWVFKTDSLGCLVYNCTGIGITEFNPNAGAQLLVYPNPFKEAFAINYSIPKESKKGVFELRDVLGSLVYATPLNTNINQLQVVASTLKAGMYVASLVVDGVVVGSQKIIKE